MADLRLPRADKGHGLRSVARHSLAILLATTALGVVSAHAATDGTWTGPGNEWTDPGNWTSNPAVPDGTATFTNTGPTAVQSNGLVSLDSVVFTAAPNAPAYTIDVNDIFLTNGTGISNNSTNAQTFRVNASMVFFNSSTASGGSAAVTYQNNGAISFVNSSTAGTAIITNSGDVEFNDTSTAANAAITNNATVNFQDSSSAGSSIIANAAGGFLAFNANATAASSTITNSGNLQFNNSSQAGSAGITNSGVMGFFNSASAAGATISNTAGNTLTFNDSSGGGNANISNDGTLQFNNSSQAGNASITNSGAMGFFDSASAASATISNTAGHTLTFNDSSSGGNAIVGNDGTLQFNDSSTAANASITTTNGATTSFTGSSSGGNARFITATGGTFDISGLATSGTTAGSIEGGGNYLLGANTLTTGSNGLSTTVDGVISGNGGGLAKVGSGTLSLTGINTYTGATTISEGTLALSGFGAISSSSSVTVNGTFDISASSFPFNLINTLAGNASGIVNLGANGLVIANGSTEFGGSIQGTGGLEVIAGTQTLSGTNTYTNATQIDAGATLALRGSGSIASSAFIGFSPGGPGQVGTFDISQTTAGASVGALFDSAGVGVVALGSQTLTITNGSLFSGVIQDGGIGGGTGGGLTIANGATQVLSGINTYTGATTISSAGTLALTGAGSISNSSVVTVNGTFDVSAAATPFVVIKTLAGGANGIVDLGTGELAIGSGSTEFQGSIQGTGGLEVIAGTQTLSGTNTYTAPTFMASGATLALRGSGSIANSALVILSSGGTLDISQTTGGASIKGLFDSTGGSVVALGSQTLTITSGSLVYKGVIEDGGIGGGTGGGLTIASGAAQPLSGINTYTGATTIAAGGELALTGNGSIATSSGVISNGIFDISGLTSGGTSIKALSGASTGVVNLGAQTLTLTNANGTFAGVIQNVGAAGNLVLAGGTQVLSGINTYTGSTTVNAGTLVVDGSIATSALTTVNAGGTLAGNGIVGNTQITGGTLAPGSAGGSIFGPLTVQGNLAFTTASTYMVQVSPTNAGLTNVTGSANLGGAGVNAVFLPGSYVDKKYTILTATGGLGGTSFNPAVVSNNPNLQSTLSYDANDVFLNIKLAFVPPTGLNINQQNVANTLTNFFNTTGSIPTAFAMLNAAGLTVASGELGTGVIQSSIKADSQFLDLLLDPSIAGRGAGFTAPGSATQFAAGDNASAYAEKRLATPSERAAYAMATKAPLFAAQPANRWSVWGASYGGSAKTDGNAVVGSQDTTARVWGVAAGADYKLTPDTLVGFALAGGGTSFSLANGLGSGSADLFQAGIFGRHNIGPAYLSAALAYGWHDVTTNRTVTLAGFDQLQARFRAESFSGRFEAGYRFATPMVGITPYAAAQVISFNLPAYAEQAIVGGPMFALSYAAQTTTATRSELGLRTDKSYALQDGVLTLRGRAAWAHDYNTDRSVTALFQALPGTSFVVNGATGKPDGPLVSGGAEMKWLSGFSLAATFEGEFSGNTTSYAGKGVAKYSW